MSIKGESVLVALSGGVDSSVCVHLLKEQGCYVEAVVMDFSPHHSQAVADAKAVADKLDVKLHVVECHSEFQANVIDYFAKEYLAGRTPNPCIICNPTTKFHFLDKLRCELGFKYMATGHYADIERTHDGACYLRKSGVADKDQSYMLYRLTDELRSLVFPLNNLSKPQVREIAAAAALPSANKPDSQEVCFIPDNDYTAFIESRYGVGKKGRLIDPDGNCIGENKGIMHYTVGQRKGLGVALGVPVFVKRIDAMSGDVFLGRKGDEYAARMILEQCVMSAHPYVKEGMEAGIKIRSMAKECPCTAHSLGDNRWEIVFAQPQRAPAPGQSAVLYHGDIVLGGGIIAETAE